MCLATIHCSIKEIHSELHMNRVGRHDQVTDKTSVPSTTILSVTHLKMDLYTP